MFRTWALTKLNAALYAVSYRYNCPQKKVHILANIDKAMKKTALVSKSLRKLRGLF